MKNQSLFFFFLSEDRTSSSKWKNFKTHCSNNILTLDGEGSYFSGNTFLRGWDVQNKMRNYIKKENSGVLHAASHLLPFKTKMKSYFCIVAFSVEKHYLQKQNQLPTKQHTLNNFNTESTREALLYDLFDEWCPLLCSEFLYVKFLPITAGFSGSTISWEGKWQ